MKSGGHDEHTDFYKKKKPFDHQKHLRLVERKYNVINCYNVYLSDGRCHI